MAALPAVRKELDKAGVALWAWPLCADQDAENAEAGDVLAWADRYALTGVLVEADVEGRTSGRLCWSPL